MSDPNGYDDNQEALTSANALAASAADGLMEHLRAHTDLSPNEIQQRCDTLFDFVAAISHPSWTSDGNGAD